MTTAELLNQGSKGKRQYGPNALSFLHKDVTGYQAAVPRHLQTRWSVVSTGSGSFTEAAQLGSGCDVGAPCAGVRGRKPMVGRVRRVHSSWRTHPSGSHLLQLLVIAKAGHRARWQEEEGQIQNKEMAPKREILGTLGRARP